MPALKADVPVPRSAAIDTFLAELSHPLAQEAALLRTTVRDADDRLLEGIKWNAPSFHHRDWFATFHLRARQEITLILHRGAKTKAPPKGRFVADPAGLVTWLANDRGKVSFASRAEILTKTAALQQLIRSWLDAMDADAGR